MSSQSATAPVVPEGQSAARRWFGANRAALGLVPALIVLAFVGVRVNAAFATPENIKTILLQSAVLGFLVVAESLVLISGRFDLSLESTAAFAPFLAVWLLTDPPAAATNNGGIGLIDSPALAYAVVIAAGALIGLINGFLIVVVKLNAFMVTLAMLILVRGLIYPMTDGAAISRPNDTLMWPGQGLIFGIPVQIILTLGLFAVVSFFLRYHRAGRAIYAVGGSTEAARAAGIRADRLIIQVFVAAGIIAAIGGLILAGRVDSVTATQGRGLIFEVFAAAVIGGISLNGGRGSVLSAGLGVLFLSMLGNVLTLAQVPSQIIDAVRGGVIVAALLLNRLTLEVED
jgi:simple sugar transport system permease protein